MLEQIRRETDNVDNAQLGHSFLALALGRAGWGGGIVETNVSVGVSRGLPQRKPSFAFVPQSQYTYSVYAPSIRLRGSATETYCDLLPLSISSCTESIHRPCHDPSNDSTHAWTARVRTRRLERSTERGIALFSIRCRCRVTHIMNAASWTKICPSPLLRNELLPQAIRSIRPAWRIGRIWIYKLASRGWAIGHCEQKGKRQDQGTHVKFGVGWTIVWRTNRLNY